MSSPKFERLRAQHLEADAFVMARARELVEIGVLDDAIAEPVLHAPGEHGFQRGNARFGEIDLAQRFGPSCERGEARVESVETDLACSACVRCGVRRVFALDTRRALAPGALTRESGDFESARGSARASRARDHGDS